MKRLLFAPLFLTLLIPAAFTHPHAAVINVELGTIGSEEENIGQDPGAMGEESQPTADVEDTVLNSNIGVN